MVQSLAIYQNDVYITGYTTKGEKRLACYWKNGVRNDLTVNGKKEYSTCRSIFIDQGDIYICGAYLIESSMVACYWKNGNNIDLTDPINERALSTSIFVLDNNVYIAGFSNMKDGSDTKAWYWKNGKREFLDGTIAFSIFVTK